MFLRLKERWTSCSAVNFPQLGQPTRRLGAAHSALAAYKTGRNVRSLWRVSGRQIRNSFRWSEERVRFLSVVPTAL